MKINEKKWNRYAIALMIVNVILITTYLILFT